MKPKRDRAAVMAPPPLLLALCVAAGFGADYLKRVPLFSVVPPFHRPLYFGLFVLAAVIFVSAIGGMIRHKTHPSPYRPTEVLVVAGIYRLTRNPIYIAFLLVAVALAVETNSAWLLLSAVVLFVLLHFGVVRREEEYLSGKFGSAYDDYQRRVRRWV